MKRFTLLLHGVLALTGCREEPVRVASKQVDPPAPAAEVAKSPIKVVVTGNVLKGGAHLLPAGASIEAAFAAAGGWAGKGGLSPDGDHPANYCILNSAGDPASKLRKLRKVRIGVDKMTRRIAVMDPEWSGYQLSDGDILTVPDMFF
jgi:hypothetical protein